MIPKFYTVQQLARCAGISERTVRYHVQQRWLKAEPESDGVRGLRFDERNACRWLRIHYPGRSLNVEQPVKPKQQRGNKKVLAL